MLKSQRRNVSEDPQTIRRSSSRLSSTDELLLNIPIDVIIDIFSRLPLKSIARCGCVSKRWASLCLTKSLVRPQLLFARQKENEVLFSSSPQPQNFGENVSLIATNHVRFPVEHVYDISSSFNGYLCISHYRILDGIKTRELVSMICNPSTKQSFTLPKMKTRKMTAMRSFLGYDPVEKQYKVLATILDKSGVDHQCCGPSSSYINRTLEPHYDLGPDYICINGVFFYMASASSYNDTLVCFDVRSEKYSFVNFMERGMLPATLINFQGKLALVKSSAPSFLSGISASLEMWILEDPEKHEWSKRIFILPPMWKDAPAKEFLQFVGVTATNEFAFAHPFPSDIFHVYYYIFVKEVITRVEIQGMGAFEKVSRVHIFLNHVEDVKLM
ncbi:hypothetical protein Bca52824_010411 [Brassica carinata]|uniref:F-box domain-containing protein n=1 Tax=Brassica carinata TaxID=52824 RepID=A0A8X8BAU0_BRACI|nr:hypothetical protein Bca52824_010411 [Brassica carinata]